MEEGGKNTTSDVNTPDVRVKRKRTGKSLCVAAAKNIRLIAFPLMHLNFPTNVRINQVGVVEKYLRQWWYMTEAKGILMPMTRCLLEMCRLGQLEVWKSYRGILM